MSSESEKGKERLVQAAKTFFFQMHDISSFTKTLIEFFNSNMNTQIAYVTLKEDGYIKDAFEQMLKIFKEVQSVVEDKMQKEPLCSKIATAMCSMVEKTTNVKELHHSAREMFKNVQTTPVFVSLLSSGGNILESFESSLSTLMKYPIMNLQLSDFYSKDAKEQSDASTSEKTSSPGPSKITTTEILKKLQDALKSENVKHTIESATDQLEQIIKTLVPILEILQKAINGMDTVVSVPKTVSNKKE
ncbi:uncharacterized protein C12orf60 homolog [Erinaceus europaeus]|uniref:Uncharacterized protein C12orf60 homolog n=1 Tax=Erinaceus europaeus TaxID=9365 RepID=A0A1S3AD99_ERIEU|nr:uncharacterized protein C12orf60 homolog [Erinaceus europaeus]XP_060050408.1 uncharacterized protein C12orf60 homolog [Erinaceus europaeus]